METTKTLPRHPLLSALTALLLASGTQAAHAECPAAQAEPLVPTSPARCAALAAEVRDPGALPLDQYEARLADVSDPLVSPRHRRGLGAGQAHPRYRPLHRDAAGRQGRPMER